MEKFALPDQAKVIKAIKAVLRQDRPRV